MSECPKCGGSGHYAYDDNHAKICEVCCPHDQGWFELKEHYGNRNGQMCCKRGCGFTRERTPHDER